MADPLDLKLRSEKGSPSSIAGRLTVEEHDDNMEKIEAAVNEVTQNVPQSGVWGRPNMAGAGPAQFLTQSQLRDVIDTFDETARGLVPPTNSTDSRRLIFDDGTWRRPVLADLEDLSDFNSVKVNLTATADPTPTDDSDAGYSVLSLWINTTSSEAFVCTNPSVGSAQWDQFSGDLAGLDRVTGLRQDWGEIALDASSEDVSIPGDTNALLIIVEGHTVARNLDITPIANVAARTFLIANTGTEDVNVQNNSVPVDSVASGDTQFYHWASGVLTAGFTLLGSATGLAGVADNFVVDLDDLTSLVANTHRYYHLDGTTFQIRPMRPRNGSDQTNPVDIIIPSGFSSSVAFHVAEDQTGVVRVNTPRTQAYTGLSGTFTVGEDVTWTGGSARIFADAGAILTLVNLAGVDPTGTMTGASSGATATASGALAGTATINGGTVATFAGPGASGWLQAVNSDVYRLKGETTGDVEGLTIGTGASLADTLDANENEITGFKVPVVSASGLLNVKAHSGAVILTTGPVTIPNVAKFHCTLIAGGAHTVTFNGQTSAAMAVDDWMTVVIPTVGAWKARLSPASENVPLS